MLPWISKMTTWVSAPSHESEGTDATGLLDQGNQTGSHTVKCLVRPSSM